MTIGWTSISDGEYHRPPCRAPVAQLDRVSASEAEGPAFESRQAHQVTYVPARTPVLVLVLLRCEVADQGE